MRWHTVAARLAVGFASLALLGGCTAGATPSPSVRSRHRRWSARLPRQRRRRLRRPLAVSLAQPIAHASPPPPDPTASPAPKPTGSFVGQVVTTLADDGLRVRPSHASATTRRRVAAAAARHPAVRPRRPGVGLRLCLVRGRPDLRLGPRSGSGTLPSGWVASAGRDGEPWIAAGDVRLSAAADRLPVPGGATPGVGLACFPRVPITVQARLISCYCDIDGAWYTPWWFTLNETPLLLVAPDVTSAPPDMADWFGLNRTRAQGRTAGRQDRAPGRPRRRVMRG